LLPAPTANWFSAGNVSPRLSSQRPINLIYPRELTEGQSRARFASVDTKRRGPERLRSRTQASHATTLEGLDRDRYRDVMDGVTGRPHDKDRWGIRMTGADALSFGAEIRFPELGQLCRHVDQAHARDDYKGRLQLLDDIQPVTDPALRQRLCDGDLPPTQRPCLRVRPRTAGDPVSRGSVCGEGGGHQGQPVPRELGPQSELGGTGVEV